MLVRCREIAQGPGPAEIIVEVETRDGSEEVVVSRGLFRDGGLEVGHPIGDRDGYALVELPREASSGKWRIWVATSSLFQGALAA